MRLAVPVVIVVCCGGLLLLCLVGLALVRLGDLTTFGLPDAVSVDIELTGRACQHSTYRLVPNWTQGDLSRHLLQDGWTREMYGELAGADTSRLFWRQSWFGLASEVVTLRRATHGRRVVEIQLSRCFAIDTPLHLL